MARFARWVISVALIEGGLLLLLAWLLDGFAVGGVISAAVLALVLTGLQTVAWPALYALTSRIHPFVFPVLNFLLAGGLVLAAAWVADRFSFLGVRVADLWTAILVALGLTAGSTLLAVLFSLDDEAMFDRYVTGPLRRRYEGTPRVAEPGVLFLEIDGLAEPVLHQALAEGYLPTLRRWLDSGTHTITAWEPDLSSQTSASQAGILLGDNDGIPAFRWWDKGTGTLMVSSKMATARHLEARLASGDGLLIDDGGSRWNVFSGDAMDCACVFSTFGDPERSRTTEYVAFFANPYSLARTLTLFAADIVRERWQARQQVRQDIRPRIDRTWKYAPVRAATTTLMEEASFFMIAADMLRGVPAVYNTFYAYDEVAHHSGIDRPDALKVLRTIDRGFARLERVAQHAARPYHLVILSDHGQSQGATFKQRCGYTLGELVERLLSDEARVAHVLSSQEDWHNLNLALSEAIQHDSRTGRLARRALHKRTRGHEVELTPDDAQSEVEDASASDVVVVASGNLGLVSFPKWPERMSYEELEDRFPGLIKGLVDHEWIGFVLVRSSEEGGLVIGKDGVYYLDHGYAAGGDPLAPYGPNAAEHVKREHGFANCPDILIMSWFDPATGEVAAFEELVGSHGGLGGPQTHPFVLHPTAFDPGPDPIVGAAALHRVLKRWVEEATHTSTVAPAPPSPAE